jgi:hypothetical protein
VVQCFGIAIISLNAQTPSPTANKHPVNILSQVCQNCDSFYLGLGKKGGIFGMK